MANDKSTDIFILIASGGLAIGALVTLIGGHWNAFFTCGIGGVILEFVAGRISNSHRGSWLGEMFRQGFGHLFGGLNSGSLEGCAISMLLAFVVVPIVGLAAGNLMSFVIFFTTLFHLADSCRTNTANDVSTASIEATSREAQVGHEPMANTPNAETAIPGIPPGEFAVVSVTSEAGLKLIERCNAEGKKVFED